MTYYRIEVAPFNRVCPVRKKKFRYHLTNNGEPCGDRLFKGSDAKDPKQQWPFKSKDWMFAENKQEALTAAGKLQSYLDARHKGMKK